MAPITKQYRQLARSLLTDKEYSHVFVDEAINAGLAFQIRELRGSMSQTELGRLAGGMAQGVISQYENPDYGRFQLGTLKRLARAFDVALIVRFVPFSDLVDWTANLSPTRLRPVNRRHDKKLREQAETPSEQSALAAQQLPLLVTTPLQLVVSRTPTEMTAGASTGELYQKLAV